MPQSLSFLLIHAIFSTKDRTPIRDASILPPLDAYLATVARNSGCECYRCCGVGRPRTPCDPPAPRHRDLQAGRRAKNLLLEMAQDPITLPRKLRVAKRLWRILRRPHRPRSFDPLHRHTGSPPPEAHISGRVTGLPYEIRHRMRRSLYVGSSGRSGLQPWVRRRFGDLGQRPRYNTVSDRKG